MPNVAATERVSTSLPAGIEIHPSPIPVLQPAAKLCSTCSRPLNVLDGQQQPMVPVGGVRPSLSCTCGEESKPEGDRLIGRNRANSSNASSHSIPLPLASPTPNAVLTAVLSSVSNDRGRPQFPAKSSRNPSQDARSLSRSPYSPTQASYFASRMRSPSAHPSPLDLHMTNVEPLLDISRLRVRSTGIGCLSPGETFLGIQTNQGKEHEVSVTIMVSGSLTLSDVVLAWYTCTIYENIVVRVLCSGGHCTPRALTAASTTRPMGAHFSMSSSTTDDMMSERRLCAAWSSSGLGYPLEVQVSLPFDCGRSGRCVMESPYAHRNDVNAHPPNPVKVIN
jgi:hypothetical protein